MQKHAPHHTEKRRGANAKSSGASGQAKLTNSKRAGTHPSMEAHNEATVHISGRHRINIPEKE